MRIHKLRSFHLWDTPTPPDPARTFWNSEAAVNKRVRSISLEGATGLTVYCQFGAVRWIQAHHNKSFHHPFPHANSVTQSKQLPQITNCMTPIFVPFAKGERISTVWVRKCATTNEKIFIPDTLAVRLLLLDCIRQALLAC